VYLFMVFSKRINSNFYYLSGEISVFNLTLVFAFKEGNDEMRRLLTNFNKRVNTEPERHMSISILSVC